MKFKKGNCWKLILDLYVIENEPQVFMYGPVVIYCNEHHIVVNLSHYEYYKLVMRKI